MQVVVHVHLLMFLAPHLARETMEVREFTAHTAIRRVLSKVFLTPGFSHESLGNWSQKVIYHRAVNGNVRFVRRSWQ